MKNIKIDILRAEYHGIVPPEFHPDLETQANQSIHPLSYFFHGEGSMVIKREGVVVPTSNTNSDYIKAVSAYHVLFTDALLQQIPNLPKSQRDIACGFGDIYKFRENLKSFMQQTYFSFKPDLTPKRVDEIWDSIKSAYGSEFAPPDQAIFKNLKSLAQYNGEETFSQETQKVRTITVHRMEHIIDKLQQRIPFM